MGYERIVSQSKSNNIKEVFFSLPFTQKEFREELVWVSEEIKYRPGNSRYCEAELEFRRFC